MEKSCDIVPISPVRTALVVATAFAGCHNPKPIPPNPALAFCEALRHANGFEDKGHGKGVSYKKGELPGYLRIDVHREAEFKFAGDTTTVSCEYEIDIPGPLPYPLADLIDCCSARANDVLNGKSGSADTDKFFRAATRRLRRVDVWHGQSPLCMRDHSFGLSGDGDQPDYKGPDGKLDQIWRRDWIGDDTHDRHNFDILASSGNPVLAFIVHKTQLAYEGVLATAADRLKKGQISPRSRHRAAR